MCACNDENIGELEILSEAGIGLLGGSLDLTMALTRTDTWSAEIVAWVTQAHLKDLTTVRRKINYCPMCGRRLSLRDAGREEE